MSRIKPLQKTTVMRSRLQLVAAAILLSLLTNLARSAIIQKDFFGADTEDDYLLAAQMLKEHYLEAFTKMVGSGPVEVFKKGEIVSVGGHGGTMGYLLQVRKTGDLEYYLIDPTLVDNSAPGEAPSNNQATAGLAAEDHNQGNAPEKHDAAPPPKPTPVLPTEISTPKGFDGKATGIKLFLNQEPDAWIKYYGTKMGHDSTGSQYRWYVGRFELLVGFDRQSHKADWVNLSAQPCTQLLTLEEAKEVMSSLGLKNFQPYSEGAIAGTWGQSDGPIQATFQGNDDHLLSIETQLLQNSGAVITD